MKLKKYVLSSLIILFTASVSQALTWKGIFIAGDDSIENFDNGREDLTAQFSKMGTLQSLQLSSSNKYISVEKNVYEANANNLVGAFRQLGSISAEACLIHMTSHGAQGKGFYLSRAGILSPAYFEQLVNKACGNLPTVVLVSACYSGQFITEKLKGPNRVILTAARADRPSFGCSADTEYTYWDHCLLNELPRSEKWTDLYANVQACISEKESVLHAKPSGPQAFFGVNTKDWKILH